MVGGVSTLTGNWSAKKTVAGSEEGEEYDGEQLEWLEEAPRKGMLALRPRS